MDLPKILAQHVERLEKLCQECGVERLYAFGSVLSHRFDAEKSDLDFLVEMQEGMPPLLRGEKLIVFWESLEDLFSKKVDLISMQPIKNPYLRQSVESTKQLIYDRKSQKISS